KTWDIMNPLERWQHSPPENEPAPLTAIKRAVATTSPAESSGSSLSSATGNRDTLLSSGSLSNLSLGSSMSHGSRNSHGSLGSRGKDRRRRRRTAANPSKTLKVQELRPFQCTFCTDRFRTKYDWSRHEKSLHLSLEKWICAPIGPVVVQSDGVRKCVYCSELNPSEEHSETHNHRQCEDKGIDARTFYRKDHLRQHLRLVHGCTMTPAMEFWKSEATYIKSRCGFCKQHFDKWQDRIDHLAKHFKAGAQMKDWKGCRGLDPAVAANVTNAMPPYLIGNEALSPVPFSASNESSWQQAGRGTYSPTQNNLAAITCWEILTVRLAQYVQEQITLGILPTDEDLQRQARQILYEDDDSWNQTAADNLEWLELFKKAHGL
ncbi:hypothetical protein EJ08DRAFT_567024, partial [Tothia fuscella]